MVRVSSRVMDRVASRLSIKNMVRVIVGLRFREMVAS